MTGTSSASKLRFRVGVCTTAILVVHICLAATASFNNTVATNNPLLKVYRQLVVLGPFFAESRIKHSHFFSVQFFRHGEWSETIQPANENFEYYTEYPGRVDKTALIAYEKYLTSQVGELSKTRNMAEVQRSRSFRELATFVSEEYDGANDVPADSIRLVYGLKEYLPKSKSYRPDTLFAHTFNPAAVVDASN